MAPQGENDETQHVLSWHDVDRHTRAPCAGRAAVPGHRDRQRGQPGIQHQQCGASGGTVLYDAGGLHDLGTLLPSGNSIGNDINNLGQIVGFTDTVNGDRGFLLLDGAMTLLDTLIDPASGWAISEASAINELQQIAATGCKEGVCYAVRLDLAAAIPEPQQVILLFAGMLLIVLARTRIIIQTNDPRTRRGSFDRGSMRIAQTI